MVDTRPMAREKARKHAEEMKVRRDALQAGHPVQTDAPPGSGLESERQRAKNALREEVNTYDGSGVHKIAAATAENADERILRVAAYCRVSTDDIEQIVSIEMQKNNYRDMIKQNPKWKYAGTYVDDGFSGTNTDHRPAFRLMMRDAMAGKFDMIITKSVSRFARNLLDCIGWVRKLQEHDPPIPVFFEQEHLNTLDPTSSIILFVLAMVAEEESHMKSEAMLLSLEWRLSRGRFLTPKLLGYDKVEVEENGVKKKKLVINEDQAQTVRLMYYMLLNGSSTREIAETLTELGRETTGRCRSDGSPNTRWTATGVATVMRNERYCGDVLARKTWTPNFHDHKSVKNRGKKNKYYQPAHHDAIITRAQWNAAQKILNSHQYAHKGSYQPMRIIDHGALRGYISINRSWAGYEDDEYYRASSIAMGLAKGELQINLDEAHLPDGGHRITGLTDEGGIQRIARELTAVEKRVKAQLEGKSPEEICEQEKAPQKKGFQVVDGSMFSHAFEPVIRITRSGIAFNSTCIAKLNRVTSEDGQPILTRCEYVEILFNPIERMLVVRPCDQSHPNAVRWTDDRGKSVYLGATAFCGLLFRILDWDEQYSFRVPASVRTNSGASVIFFDLDNYIGHENAPKTETASTAEESAITVAEDREDAKGIFFSADDEEEPQELEKIEEMENRLSQLADEHRKHFGTPVFEHKGGIRMQDFPEDEWDLLAEAVPMDEDHQIGEDIILQLRDDMEEALYTTYDEEDEE